MNLIIAYFKWIEKEWCEYWFKRISPYPISAFRILYGFYLLFYFTSFAFRVDALFSSQGVYIPYFVSDIALPPLLARIAYVMTLSLIISFICGIFTFIVTPCLFLTYSYYYFLNIAVGNAACDLWNLVILFLLCFANLNSAWSLNRVKHQDNRLVLAWATRLICFQCAFFYFGAGITKMAFADWRSGLILQNALAGNYATSLAFSISQWNLPSQFYMAVSWLIIIFEVAMWPALYSRKFQNYAFIMGFLFHLSIWLFLGIWEFMNFPAAYVLFIDPDKVKSMGNSIFRKWRKLSNITNT